MFSDNGPPFATLTNQEDTNPSSPMRNIMLKLAKRRQDNTPTSDVAAAFREGEKAPVAWASI